jgi:hypothetical protein
MTALHLICSLILESPKTTENLIKVCIENGGNPNIQDIVWLDLNNTRIVRKVSIAHGSYEWEHSRSLSDAFIQQQNGSLISKHESIDNRRRDSLDESSDVL